MNFKDRPESSFPPVPEHVVSRIEATLLADLQPVIPIPSVLRMSLGLLTVSMLVVAAAIGRLGWAGWSASSALQGSIFLGILGISMALLARSLSEQMAPGSRHSSLQAPLLILPLLALAVASAELYSYEPGPRFIPAGFRCWRAGVACAAATAPMFWLMLRRGFPLSTIQHVATAGLLAGLTGVTVLTIECNYLDSAHIATWHLGAGLAATAVGAVMGYWARSRRQRRAA